MTIMRNPLVSSLRGCRQSPGVPFIQEALKNWNEYLPPEGQFGTCSQLLCQASGTPVVSLAVLPVTHFHHSDCVSCTALK